MFLNMRAAEFWTEERLEELVSQARITPLAKLSRNWKRPKQEILKVLRQNKAPILLRTYPWRGHTVKVYAQGCSGLPPYEMTSTY